MKKLLLAAATLALAACGNNTAGAPGPSIESFSATPATIMVGESATLRWSTRNATQFSIDQGIGEVNGTTTVVKPTRTTTYTLTASGAGGSTTATVKVTVTTAQAPAIGSFVATPATIAKGTSSTLQWTVTGATTLSISPQPGTVTGSQVTVSPVETTTYTLTATNAVSSVTATATVTVRPPVLHVDYLDPTGTTGALRLVKNVNNSSDTRLQLDLVVAKGPLTAYGLAMNLPFDVTRAKISTADPLRVGTSFNVGASPPMLVAKVPATGPLQNALVMGFANKQRGAETQIPTGTVIFSLTFELVPGAPVGTVFDGQRPPALFDAALIRADGSRAVDRAGFEIGLMFVAL